MEHFSIMASVKITRPRLIFLAVVIALTLGVGFYFQEVVVPVKIKRLAIQQAEEILHTKVTIGTIRFHWLKGFTVSDVKIFEKPSGEQPIFIIPELSFGLIYKPLGRPKIILPYVNVNYPTAFLSCADGRWNFADFLPASVPSAPPVPAKGIRPSPGSAALTMDTILIKKVNLTGGRVRLSHRCGAQPLFETFEHTKASFNIVLSTPPKIQYHLTTEIFSSRGELSVQGSFVPSLFEGRAEVAAKNIPLATYAGLFPFPQLSLYRWEQGLLDSAQLTAEFNSRSTKTQGNLAFKDLVFSAAGGKGASIPSLNFDGTFERNEKNKITYEGNIQAKETNLTLSPTQKFQGNIGFQEVKLEIPDQDNISVSGLLSAQNAVLQLDEDRRYAADLTAQDFHLFVQNKKNVHLQTDLKLSKASAVFSPQNKFTGDASSQQLSFMWKDNLLTLRGNFSLSEARYFLSPLISLAGSCEGSLDFHYDPAETIPVNFHHTFVLDSASLDGIPFGQGKNVRGTLEWEPGEVSSERLTMDFLDAKVSLKGRVKNFSQPFLKLDVSADHLNLAQLKEYVPFLNKDRSRWDISGGATFDGHYQGLVAQPLESQFSLDAEITDAAVRGDRWGPIIAINGKILAQERAIELKNLSAQALGENLHLNAALKFSPGPVVEAALRSERMDLKTKVNILRQDLEIVELLGNFFNSTVNIKGDYIFRGPDAPALKLNGNLAVDLKTLKEFYPQFVGPLPPGLTWLDLDGLMSTSMDFLAKEPDWKKWQYTLFGQSPQIHDHGLTLNNAVLQMTQRREKIYPFNLTGTLYGGPLSVVGALKLNANTFPFDAGVKLEKCDVRQLAAVWTELNKKIAGELALTALLEGSSVDLKRLNGKGNFTIKEGYLKEVKALSGLMSVLNGILNLKDSAITDAQANFQIRNQRVLTQHLILHGPGLALIGQGWVDFHQNVYFVVSPEVSLVPSSINPTAGVWEITLFGKLNDLKSKHRIIVPKVLKKTLQKTTETLGTVGGEVIKGIQNTLKNF